MRQTAFFRTRWALALLLPLACAAQSQGPSVHEQQLTRLREALTQATLQAPTQVVSTAWIDGQGALREDVQFNSKAEIRGIRLHNTGTNEDPAVPRVTADVLPWGWRLTETAESSCPSAPRTWRLPLTVSTDLDNSLPGQQRGPSQSLLLSLEQQLHVLALQTQRWSPRPLQRPTGNTYLQALTAPASDDAPGWQLHLRLNPDSLPPVAALGVPTPEGGTATHAWWTPPAWAWTLDVDLRHSEMGPSARMRWSQRFHIEVDPQAVAQHPTAWRGPIEVELTRRLALWFHKIQTQMRCEPTPFQVRHDASGLLLMAGQDSGLRSGDRILIMQPGWVPGRLLDPQVADHLALAEVVRTRSRHTEIRQLAGPPLPPGKDWVALPL